MIDEVQTVNHFARCSIHRGGAQGPKAGYQADQYGWAFFIVKHKSRQLPGFFLFKSLSTFLIEEMDTIPGNT